MDDPGMFRVSRESTDTDPGMFRVSRESMDTLTGGGGGGGGRKPGVHG